MSKITEFPRKPTDPPTEPRIWVCKCGCSTFELLETGETKCALCENITDHNGGWHEYPSDAEWTGDGPMKDIRGNDDLVFVKELMKSRVDSEEAIVVVVLEKSGRLHTWTSAETQEQIEWSIMQLTDVPGALRVLSKDKF